MYKQAPKSPAMKALVGNQKNLPAGLKAQIEASPAKQTAKPKSKFDGYESIGESDTEKGAHLIRGKSVKSSTAATDHRMSKTAEGKYKVYKSVSPAKQVGKKKSITPDAMRTKKEKERQAKLAAVRENSRAMKEERAVLAKRKRNSKLGSSNKELAVIDRLQKKGRTKDLKKS